MASTATPIRTPRLARLLVPRPIAGRWRNAARLAFGGFYLAMATYNATVILPNAAASYTDIAHNLAWPGFDWLLLLHLVVPAAVPFTVLLIAFEVGVAVLVLSPRASGYGWGCWRRWPSRSAWRRCCPGTSWATCRWWPWRCCC